MSEELKPAAVHEANVFLPGGLGPVRREVVLVYEHDRVVDALRAELSAIKGVGEAVGEINEGDEGVFVELYPDQSFTLGTKLYTRPPVVAEAEPVMWVNPNVIGADMKINWPTAITFSNRGPCHGWTFPLYAAPPASGAVPVRPELLCKLVEEGCIGSVTDAEWAELHALLAKGVE